MYINYIPLKSDVFVYYYYYLHRRRRRHVIARFVYYVQGLARGTADDDDGPNRARPVGRSELVSRACVYHQRSRPIGTRI